MTIPESLQLDVEVLRAAIRQLTADLRTNTDESAMTRCSSCRRALADERHNINQALNRAKAQLADSYPTQQGHRGTHHDRRATPMRITVDVPDAVIDLFDKRFGNQISGEYEQEYAASSDSPYDNLAVLVWRTTQGAQP